MDNTTNNKFNNNCDNVCCKEKENSLKIMVIFKETKR